MSRSWINPFLRNTTGPLLRVCAAPWLPWINVTQTSPSEVKIAGPMAAILQNLASLLNFRYLIVIPPDGQWGVKKEDGEWTGMVGMVHRNNCDMILGPLASTYERSMVVTYTAPPFITYLAILGGSMYEKSTNIFGYFAVFDWTVWLMVLMAIILLSLFSMYIDLILPGRTSKLGKPVTSGKNISSYFFEYLGTLLCESIPSTPDHDSARLALACWWMAVIVLMNTFTGQLKASMLLQDEGDRINDIDILAGKKSVMPMVWKGTAYEALIKGSSTPSFQKVWSRIKSGNGSQGLSILYNFKNMVQIQKTKRVVVSDLPTMKYAISTHCQNLPDGEFYISQQHFFGHTLGLAVSKIFDDKLLRRINRRIRWLVESELVNRWVTHEYGNLAKCSSSGGVSDTKMLGLKDLLAVFFLWVILLGISAGFLLTEILVFYFTKRVQRTKWKKLFQQVVASKNDPHFVVAAARPNKQLRRPRAQRIAQAVSDESDIPNFKSWR